MNEKLKKQLIKELREYLNEATEYLNKAKDKANALEQYHVEDIIEAAKRVIDFACERLTEYEMYEMLSKKDD